MQAYDDYWRVQKLSWYWGMMLNKISYGAFAPDLHCRLLPKQFRSSADSVLTWILVVLEWMWIPITMFVTSVAASLAVFIFVSIRLLFRLRPISISSPVSPFSSGDLKRIFEDVVAKFPVKPQPNDGHKTLAHERKFLETFALNNLFRYAKKIRDIGGSVKRNVRFENALHVCFPNLTAADHAKIHRLCRNDVQIHKGQDCPEKQRPAMMSYVDFWMTTTELGDSITAPTIIITHDFGACKSEETWYDGEAHITKGNMVTMTTRKGDTYTHGYHLWNDEGIIFGTRTVAQYYKLGGYGKSIVLFAYPANGAFHRDDSYALRSSGGAKTYQLAGDVVAELAENTFRFTRDRCVIGHVSAASLIRAAVTMFGSPRNDAYHANLTSLVRGRLQTDKQDISLLPQCVDMVAKLSDEYALSYGHKFHNLPVNVIDMPVWKRWIYAMTITALDHGPKFLRAIPLRVWKKLVGTGVREALLPWAWIEYTTPNYEVHIDPHDELDHGEVGRNPRVRQTPFRSAGPSSATGSDDQQLREPPQCAREPDREREHSRVGQEDVHASSDRSNPGPRPLFPVAPNHRANPPVAKSRKRVRFDNRKSDKVAMAPVCPERSTATAGARIVGTGRHECPAVEHDPATVTLQTVDRYQPLPGEVSAGGGERVAETYRSDAVFGVGFTIPAVQAAGIE
jgi:hypothetical protein